MRILCAVRSLMRILNHSRSRRRKKRNRPAPVICGPGNSDIGLVFSFRKEKEMARESVQTAKAPQAIGPYNQAIKVNGFVYTAGQIPIDPETGNFVQGAIREQTRQVMKNLEAVLQAAGSSMNSV